jgi:hypothetical protein
MAAGPEDDFPAANALHLSYKVIVPRGPAVGSRERKFHARPGE